MNWMKHIIFICLSIWGTCSLEQSQMDKYLVDSLNDVSYEFAYSNPTTAYTAGEKAYELALQAKYEVGEVTALLRLGSIMYGQSNLDSAAYFYKKAENKFHVTSIDSIYLAKIYIYQATVDKSESHLSEAINKNHAAYRIAKNRSNRSVAADAMSEIGRLYKQQGNYEMALKAYHKAIADYDTLDYYQRGMVHNNLANIYYDEGRFHKALKNYHHASDNFQNGNYTQSLCNTLINIGNVFLELNNRDSAFIFYDHAENVNQGKFDKITALTALNKGVLYMQNNNLDAAKSFFLKSLEIKKTNDAHSDLLLIHQNLGDIHFIKEEHTAALNYYLKADSLTTASDNLTQRKIINEKLSSVYQALGNKEKTIEYLNQYNQFLDSLSKSHNQALIYEINYNEEKNKVEQLELTLKNERLQSEKKSLFFWLFSSILFTSTVLLFFLYRFNLQKRKTSEIEQEKLKTDQKLNELISNQELGELNAMISGREKERQRISSELHDKLGAILSTVKLYFKSIDGQINQLKAENIEQYHKANLLLDEACDETRKIAHELSDKQLGDSGLFHSVNRFKEKITGSGQLTFNVKTFGNDQRLGSINQSAIYNIIQELVNNVIKHAHATEISLQLNVFDDVFNICMEDDGIGFDVNKLIHNDGIGLKAVEVRVNKMGGTFSIDSGRGVGTTITIDIPINK